MEQINKRNSSFELLRIISMFLIVMHHFSVHGTFGIFGSFSNQKIIANLMQSGGKFGVNVFVLIGSYFLVGKKFDFKRPVTLFLNTVFYSWLTLALALIFNWPINGRIGLISAIFPIPYSYWFSGYYIILLFFAPGLNKLIELMNEKAHREAILFLTIIWVLIPTFLSRPMGYSDLALFVYLYLIAGYIKKYPSKLLDNLKITLLIFLISTVILLASVIYYNYLGIKDPNWLRNYGIYMNSNKLPTVLGSVGLFLVFRNMNLKHLPFINFIAKSMFGVYLIHDNDIMRKVLWTFVNNQRFNGGKEYLIYGLLTIIAVFIGCIVIDILKRLTVDPFINKLSTLISARLAISHMKVSEGKKADVKVLPTKRS